MCPPYNPTPLRTPFSQRYTEILGISLRYRDTVLISSLIVRFCVAACMAHVPEFRPNMTELEESILQNLNMDWATKETQLDKKFSIRELLSEPTP